MGGASFGVGALATGLAGALPDGTPRPMALTMLVALIGSAIALRLLALPKSAQA
jgi:DHA1 family bicyclomycin/chloramphenicol resistance-like MFS transporter